MYAKKQCVPLHRKKIKKLARSLLRLIKYFEKEYGIYNHILSKRSKKLIKHLKKSSEDR